jgi:hypothetical protein
MRRTCPRRWWLPLAAAATATVPLPAAHAATNAPAPSADLYVSAQAPRHNYGAARQLVVARRPARQAFMRFQLDAPPPAGSRTVLRVYPLTSSKRGLVLRHASDAPWNERRITLASAPKTGPRVVRSGPLRARHWKTIDVTRLTNSSAVVALALATTGRERIVLASRESRARAPRLELRPGSAAAPGTAGSLAAGHAGAPAPAGPGGLPGAAPAPAPAGPAPTEARPCGVTTSAPTWEHVVWVVMENKAASQIIGSSSAPYINSLAARCASATNFFAETHPSLPNYLAMTSGGTQGVTDDAAPSAHPIGAESIFSQLGGGWRSLQESMPSNCAKTSSGQYAVKHNPAAYYTNLGATCAQQDVPLTNPPDMSARFTFVTPNMCSDMHDCNVGQGDTWLATWMPRFLNSPEYRSGKTAIFLTFDEDDMSANNHIATLVISPSTPAGMTDGAQYNHYSMLRSTEEMLGLPALGGGVMAPSLRAAFRL